MTELAQGWSDETHGLMEHTAMGMMKPPSLRSQTTPSGGEETLANSSLAPEVGASQACMDGWEWDRVALPAQLATIPRGVAGITYICLNVQESHRLASQCWRGQREGCTLHSLLSFQASPTS